MDILIIITVATFIYIFPTTIVYLSRVRKLEKMIKLESPDAFMKLGEPHIILNNSLRNNLRFLSFMKNKDYETLSPEISNFCGKLRKLMVVLLITNLVMFTSFFLAMVG